MYGWVFILSIVPLKPSRIPSLGDRLSVLESFSSLKGVPQTGALATAPVYDGLEEIRTPDLRRVKATS